jgi:hypothetical protein
VLCLSSHCATRLRGQNGEVAQQGAMSVASVCFFQCQATSNGVLMLVSITRAGRSGGSGDFGCPVAALKEAAPGPVKGAACTRRVWRVEGAGGRGGRVGGAVSVGPAPVIASNGAEWHCCQHG